MSMTAQAASSTARQMLAMCRQSAMLTDADLEAGPRILGANDAFWRATGYAPGELVGQTAGVLQGAFADRKLLKRLRRSAESGAAFESRGVSYRKDGTAYLAAWHIEPVCARDGEVRYFVGEQRALSGPAQHGEELHSLRSALRALPDGILFLGSQGRVLRTNPAAADLLDRREADVLGKTLQELARDARVEVHDPGHWSVTRAAADASAEQILELRRIGHEGRGTVWTIRDTTEKRRLEALANAVNLVEQSGYVVAGIRHELGNPVHSVKMALSVLQKHGETFSQDQRDDFYARMLQEVARMEFLLGALRNYNAHESQSLCTFELNAHVSAFLRVANVGLPKSIDMDWEPWHETLTVRGDPRGLFQVLLNLVKNAGDAVESSREGRITLRVGRRGEMAAISVSDNGPGMSARGMAAIGQPFTTTKPHGTGLGLCVSQRIIAGMNGRLEFESAVSRGTTVHVLLPMGGSG